MKKLLISLSALAVISTSSSYAVSCTSHVIESRLSNVNSLTFLNEQIAKAVYISQQESNGQKPDFKSIMQNIVMPNYIQDLEPGFKLGDEDIISIAHDDINKTDIDVARYGDLFNLYYNTNPLSNNINLNGLKLEGSVAGESSKPGMDLSKIIGMLPLIWGMLGDSGTFAILGMGNLSKIIASIIDPGLLNTAAALLNTKNLTKIRDDISPESYKDLTYEQAIDTSIVSLSNFLTRFTGGSENLDWHDSSKLEENSNKAVTNLFSSIGKLTSGQVKVDLGRVIGSIDDIGELLRFVNTLLMTASNYNGQDLDEFRSSKINNFQIDIAKLLQGLSKPEGMSNIIKSLFVSGKTTQGYYKLGSSLINNMGSKLPVIDLGSMLGELAGGQEIKLDFSKLDLNRVIAQLLNDITTKGTKNDWIQVLAEELENSAENDDQKEMLKELLDMLVGPLQNSLNASLNDWMGSLYDGTLLSKISELNISLMGIININIGDLLKGLGIDLTSIQINLGETFNMFSNVSNITLDLNNLTGLFDAFIKDDAFVNAMHDFKNFPKYFGLSTDKDGAPVIAAGSVFESLAKIFNDTTGLADLIASLLKPATKTEETTKMDVSKLWNDTKISLFSNKYNVYVYSINGTDKKVQISISPNGNKWAISEINYW